LRISEKILLFLFTIPKSLKKTKYTFLQNPSGYIASAACGLFMISFPVSMTGMEIAKVLFTAAIVFDFIKKKKYKKLPATH